MSFIVSSSSATPRKIEVQAHLPGVPKTAAVGMEISESLIASKGLNKESISREETPKKLKQKKITKLKSKRIITPLQQSIDPKASVKSDGHKTDVLEHTQSSITKKVTQISARHMTTSAPEKPKKLKQKKTSKIKFKRLIASQQSLDPKTSLKLDTATKTDVSEEPKKLHQKKPSKTQKSKSSQASSKSVSLKQIPSFILPVRIWNNIFKYLPEIDRSACATTSRRLDILANHDPSVELRNMNQRKAPPNPVIRHISQGKGPSTLYLFGNPTSPKETYGIQIIRKWMEKDPTVAKTVMEICQIEQEAIGYATGYHAMNVATFSLAFFNQIFLSTPYLQDEAFPCSVPLIRFPSVHGPKTIQEFLTQYPPSVDSHEHYDHLGAVKKELLALNPYLFANLMQAGESTWEFYIENKNVSPPDILGYFKMLCAHYKVPEQPELLDTLSALQAELIELAERFSRRFLSESARDTEYQKGMILQLLIPFNLIDQVAYASLPYGKIDESTLLPLSERCLTLRTDQRSAVISSQKYEMQMRVLIQSLFVPSHGIKVIAHGCYDFFSETPPQKPSSMSPRDWEKIQTFLARKNEIIKEAKKIFSKMLLPQLVEPLHDFDNFHQLPGS